MVSETYKNLLIVAGNIGIAVVTKTASDTWAATEKQRMRFGHAEGDYMKAANRPDVIVAIVGAGLEVGLVAAGALKPVVLWITWVVVANIDLLIHAKRFYDRDNKLGIAMCLIAMICCTVIGVVLA